jgi:hypothetical protein
MRFKAFQVTTEAVAQGRRIGVYGETEKRLARMARRSAPVTSDLGNRRFNEFVLTVEEARVLWVERSVEEPLAA